MVDKAKRDDVSEGMSLWHLYNTIEAELLKTNSYKRNTLSSNNSRNFIKANYDNDKS